MKMAVDRSIMVALDVRRTLTDLSGCRPPFKRASLFVVVPNGRDESANKTPERGMSARLLTAELSPDHPSQLLTGAVSSTKCKEVIMAKQKEALAANTYRYNGVAIRVMFVADDPWFQAFDVLDALGVDRGTLQHLDDQPGAVNANRDDPLISEAGLYRLLFEINAAGARKFKRWLVADVLPALYRDEYIVRLRKIARDAREVSGDDSKKAKYRHLTSDEKAEIIKLKADGWTVQGLARKFRRGDETIRAVIRGGYPYQTKSVNRGAS